MMDEEKTGEKQEEERKKTPPLPPPAIQHLVETFFYQAMISIGKQMNPLSKKYERDLEVAKYQIGMIEMLHEKTKGNLTTEEAGHMEEILHVLRMAYLDELKRGDKE